MMFALQERLKPGDLLCYRPKGFIGWLIASRTFSRWAHVEVYAGHETSYAARDLTGVEAFPLRMSELGKALRPKKELINQGEFNWKAANNWFAVVRGQKYDLLAILRFFLPHFIKRDLDFNRQICSAFAVRFYREGGFDPVAADADADLIAPSNLAQSAAFDVIWSDGAV